MKILFRIILFLLVLALLVGMLAVLSVFTYIPWLSEYTRDLATTYDWVTMALSIVVMVGIAACVIGLIMIIAIPTKRKLYILGKDTGKIEITKQSIESSVGNTLMGIEGVKRFNVEVKGNPRPGNLKLDLKVEPKPGVDLTPLGEVVQTRVKNDLQNSLAIEPDNVNVKLKLFKYEYDADKQSANERVPRVI